MRLFIAIDPPANYKEILQNSLGPLQEALHTSGAQVHWVPMSQFHLTLQFLGECPDERVAQIREALEEALAGIPPFSISLQGFGCFPVKGMPHVLWMGANEGAGDLKQVARKVEDALEKRGFPKEKQSFHAHLTVGRIRFVRNGKRLRDQVASAPSPHIGSFGVNHVDLIQSLLGPAGPTYKILHDIPL
jgi:2'-5' RNA ligase